MLAGLQSEKSDDTNLIVQILFEIGNEDEAAEILGSFYGY